MIRNVVSYKGVIKIEYKFSFILRRSIIFSTLISGVYFIIISFSEPVITGAIVGLEKSNIYVVLGITLFFISLALTHHFEK